MSPGVPSVCPCRIHLVFTLPHELNAAVQGNPRAVYGLLFNTVSAMLIEFGRILRWLGGEIVPNGENEIHGVKLD